LRARELDRCNTSDNRITGWGYDASGNLLNDGVNAFSYDAEGHIKTVNATTAYVYDGGGARVKKLVGENTRFVYGINGELIAEFDGSTGSLKKEYISGGITIEPTAVNSNGTQYGTTDHLGTPRVITNSSGSVVSRHDYMPFGEELGAGVGGRTAAIGFSNSGDNNRKKFTGYERDSETGLDFAQARYDSSSQGRFTSPDPFAASATVGNPQTFNRYSYCANNPVNATDPTGLVAEWTSHSGLLAEKSSSRLGLDPTDDWLMGTDFGDTFETSSGSGESSPGKDLTAGGSAAGKAVEPAPEGEPQNPASGTTADRIAEIAAKNVDDESWRTSRARTAKRNPNMKFKAGEDKCNLFVYEVLLAAGVHPPTSGGKGKWPARAGEWGNPNVKNLGGWIIVTDGSVKPGDVIAQQIPYSDASGHSAIIGPDKMTYGTGINDGVISRTDWGFRLGQGGAIERLQGYGPVVIRRHQVP
jgi:RHS repeat-associated protein